MFSKGDLGEAIKGRRASRSQAELTRRAGIDPSEWSLYESGKRKPGPAKVAKIAEALGLTVAGLEELAWEERSKRLDRERHTEPETVTEPSQQQLIEMPEDRLRDIEEHVDTLSHHLKEAFRLALRR